MSDLIQRLKGLYSVGEKDGVIYEDRDFGNFTPKINLEAVALIEAQKEEIAELKKEVKHWKSNHDNIAKRLRDFTCRPDLNVNKLEKEIAVLRKEALYKTHNDLSTVRGREQQIIDNLPDELKR